MTAGEKHAIADNPKIDDAAPLRAARLVKARLESRHAVHASLDSAAAMPRFEPPASLATSGIE